MPGMRSQRAQRVSICLWWQSQEVENGRLLSSQENMAHWIPDSYDSVGLRDNQRASARLF